MKERNKKRGLNSDIDNQESITIKNNMAVLLKKLGRFTESTKFLRDCQNFRGGSESRARAAKSEDPDPMIPGADVSERKSSGSIFTKMDGDVESLRIENNLACLYDSEAVKEQDVFLINFCLLISIISNDQIVYSVSSKTNSLRQSFRSLSELLRKSQKGLVFNLLILILVYINCILKFI